MRGTSDFVFLLFVADVDGEREGKLTEVLGSHSTALSLLGRLERTKPGGDGGTHGVPARLAGGDA